MSTYKEITQIMDTLDYTKIINATPHTINEIYSGNSYGASGYLIRLDTEFKEIAREKDGVVLFERIPKDVVITDINGKEVGDADDMLEIFGKYDAIIVSAQIKMMFPKDPTILSPGELKRDPDGKPIGCKGFVIIC